MRLAVAEQLKRRSAAWALCQPLLGTLFSWPCSNSLEAESGKNMQPCGVLLSRGFGDLLALVEDVLSLCPMTAIVCEGMRVRFAAPHAVTTGSWTKTWEVQSASTGQRLIPSLAGCLTSTRDHWLVRRRAWFALDGALFSPRLVFHSKEPVNEVGKWATPRSSVLSPHTSLLGRALIARTGRISSLPPTNEASSL